MQDQDRRAARLDYKERKTIAGIYAVRCAASAQVWVGRAPNLETMRNRLWFTLRQGTNPHRDLQLAWQTHGAESFSFEELERLENEALPYARQAQLKDALARWRDRLAAATI